MYCPNCYILLDTGPCPICGTRKVREPYGDDFCYLTEKESVWSAPLTDVLAQNGIPCFTRNVLGAGITARIGIRFERLRFYVPYDRYADAQAVEQEFFSGNNTEE